MNISPHLANFDFVYYDFAGQERTEISWTTMSENAKWGEIFIPGYHVNAETRNRGGRDLNAGDRASALAPSHRYTNPRIRRARQRRRRRAWSQFPRCVRGGKVDVIKIRRGGTSEPSPCESPHVTRLRVAAPREGWSEVKKKNAHFSEYNNITIGTAGSEEYRAGRPICRKVLLCFSMWVARACLGSR